MGGNAAEICENEARRGEEVNMREAENSISSRKQQVLAIPVSWQKIFAACDCRRLTGWMGSFAALTLLLLLISGNPLEGTSNRVQASKAPASWISALTMSKNVVSNSCSGHGNYVSDYETGSGSCHCHACFMGSDCSTYNHGCVLDLNQGDPKMFEKYWLENGDFSTTIVLGWQRMSYYANSKHFFFVETELDEAIRSIHGLVGNAVTEGRYIVIGAGSTQLFQAALYALSPPNRSTPTSVVSLAPHYSGYPAVTDFLRSALYKWAGDAAVLTAEEDNSYIEVVATPNNPTGEVRFPVAKGGGAVVYDLAYYWPHYTPITEPADNDLMLFGVSKSTGHAGTRIGWAIVKDLKVAQQMAKFIELNTIGVSKDAQIRATQILRSITNEYRGGAATELGGPSLFHYGSSEMAYRWMRLRSTLEGSVRFSLPEFEPAFCRFLGRIKTPTPAFAWLQCNEEDDCEKFLKREGILGRSGTYFGADASFVRVSMLDRRPHFEILMERLKALETAGP